MQYQNSSELEFEDLSNQKGVLIKIVIGREG
jgi:hypothetical protein